MLVTNVSRIKAQSEVSGKAWNIPQLFTAASHVHIKQHGLFLPLINVYLNLARGQGVTAANAALLSSRKRAECFVYTCAENFINPIKNENFQLAICFWVKIYGSKIGSMLSWSVI